MVSPTAMLKYQRGDWFKGASTSNYLRFSHGFPIIIPSNQSNFLKVTEMADVWPGMALLDELESSHGHPSMGDYPAW